jgi:hypothetical protein
MTLKETAPVNPQAEREYLLHALRASTARARYLANILEQVGVSLRHRAVDTDAAMKWLADEHVLDYVQIGPPGASQ